MHAAEAQRWAMIHQSGSPDLGSGGFNGDGYRGIRKGPDFKLMSGNDFKPVATVVAITLAVTFEKSKGQG